MGKLFQKKLWATLDRVIISLIALWGMCQLIWSIYFRFLQFAHNSQVINIFVLFFVLIVYQLSLLIKHIAELMKVIKEKTNPSE